MSDPSTNDPGAAKVIADIFDEIDVEEYAFVESGIIADMVISRLNDAGLKVVRKHQ